MKRALAIVAVFAVFALLPAGASATGALAKGEAKAAATGAIQRYYGDAWRYGSYKYVEANRRISRTRWAVEYQFEYVPDEFCYGEVIAWRGRYGRIFTDVRPDTELSGPNCH